MFTNELGIKKESDLRRFAFFICHGRIIALKLVRRQISRLFLCTRGQRMRVGTPLPDFL